MAEYTSIFKPFYTDGWENQPSENTPIMGEALNAYDETLENIEEFLSTRLPLSVGYSIQALFTTVGTLKIYLLDSFGSILSEKSLELGGMIITDMSFADGVLTVTYKNGNTKNVDITSLLDLITPDITTTDQTTLYNSHSGKLKINKIGGQMEQESTTGKNLIPISEYATNTSGDTSKYMSIPKLEQGKTYIVSAKTLDGSVVTGGDCQLLWYDAEGNTIFSSINSWFTNGFTFNSDLSNATQFAIYTASTIAGKKIQIQLEEGTVATNYEEYNGGIASPNPSYQQEIKCVKGKNRLDCRGFEENTVNGITVTPVKDEFGNVLYIELNGTYTYTELYLHDLGSTELKRGEPYILSGSNLLTLRNSDGNVTYAAADTIYTPTEDITVYCKLRVGNGETYTNERVYPMIRPASVVDSTYVPYGLMRIKTHGKNVCPTYEANVRSDANFTTEKLRVSGNTTIAISCTKERISGETINNTLLYIISYIYEYDKNGKLLKKTQPDAVALASGKIRWGYTITTQEDTNYIILDFNNNNGDIVVNTKVYDVQVEYGTTVTEYEPYTSSEITLSQPIELYGKDGVQDVITPKEIGRKYAKLVLNANKIVLSGYYEATNTNRFVIDTSSLLSIGIVNHLMCNIAKSTTGGADANTCRIYNATQIFLFLDADEFPDKASLATYLETNEVYFVYELAEPTTEPLPIVDQIALNSLLTYYGVTYVEFDSEIQPTLEAEYGTSKVGGYTLEARQTAIVNGLKQEMANERITALEATLVNNI